MSAIGLHLFDTALGACGLAWSARGVVGLQLSEGSHEETRARLQRRFPSACETGPAGAAKAAVEAVTALLSGEARDLTDIVLDLERTPAFDRNVYAFARSIPPGATLTYGEVAAKLGDAGLARAVGQALGRNPIPIIVPCHRVLAAGGKLGGFTARGGVETKLRLLAIEGAGLFLPLG